MSSPIISGSFKLIKHVIFSFNLFTYFFNSIPLVKITIGILELFFENNSNISRIWLKLECNVGSPPITPILEILSLDKNSKISSSCFLCRQTISEFFSRDAEIILYSNDGEKETYTVEDLCPYPFCSNDLK